MNDEKPYRRKGEVPPCDALHADDGVDPRKFFDDRDHRPGADRKTRMLCAQVAERLRFHFAWECADAALDGVDVLGVEPRPDAARLAVQIGVPEGRAAGVVEAALARAAGRIRSVVAAVIARKRVPELTFQVRTEEER